MVRRSVCAVLGAALVGVGLCGVAPSGAAAGFNLTRIAGATRDATAVAASNELFAATGSAKAVVVASDAAFADALAGAPLAAAKSGPLLLTTPTGLDPIVATEIMRVLPAGGTVYILGGAAAVAMSVDAALVAKGFQVQRLFGADRFATAVAVAGALGNPTTVLEATGLDFPDGLAAGAAAVQAGAAVLLTNGPTQALETAVYLTAHPGTHYAIGGPAHQADPTATAVVGSDRYASAVDVAATFWAAPKAFIGFASGATFPDALSGGANIGSHGGPLLLVPPTGPLPSSVGSYLGALPATTTTGLLYGGLAAVGDDVNAEIWGEPPASGRCHTAGLSVTTGQGNSSAGHPTVLLIFTNTSGSTCAVSGYVGLQMLDASNNALPTTVVPNGGMLSNQPLAQVVTLAPGQQASTLVMWTDVPTGAQACSTSAKLQVSPPDEPTSLTVAATIVSCGGELDVTALRAGAQAP
jgi:Protein of unknown function (DUF4232)/ell wall binding domain 2 (CWB2)